VLTSYLYSSPLKNYNYKLVNIFTYVSYHDDDRHVLPPSMCLYVFRGFVNFHGNHSFCHTCFCVLIVIIFITGVSSYFYYPRNKHRLLLDNMVLFILYYFIISIHHNMALGCAFYIECVSSQLVQLEQIGL
jgi:hypothetical protein